mmetsp:Transcript_4995/g.8204  ORF Transcript_4995/g.8204 Transcript_4995/m.8204 type:complete len:277 (-) Transcript_4995:49-879(-)
MKIISITITANTALWLLLLMVLPQCCVSTVVAAPYRGKTIQNVDSGEEIYQLYQDKLQEYQDKAFSNSVGWKTLKKTNDEIEISILPSDDARDCPYIRMRATMPTTALKLQSFMSFKNWKIFMPLINPFYQGMSVVKEYSTGTAQMVMARKLSTRIFGFGRRDFSLLSIVEDHDAPKRNDGVLVSGSISVIAPEHIPRYQGFTRAFQDMVCFYKAVDSNAEGHDQTELTIILRTDLNDSTDGGSGGYVPMWLVAKTLGIAGSKAMHGLRNVVKKQM